MKQLWMGVLLILALSFFGADTQARTGGCADTKSTEVPGQVVSGPTYFMCEGVTTTIGMVTIGINPQACFQHVITYPPYQECQGEVLSGNRCMAEGPVPVMIEEYHCVPEYSFFGLWLSGHSCELLDTRIFNHVQDFQTLPCLPCVDPDREPAGDPTKLGG